MAVIRSSSGGTLGASSDIRVDGLTDTLKALRRAGVDTVELKALNFEAGTIVAKKVPLGKYVDTGEMSTTLRVAKALNMAKISLGLKNRGWYASFILYGAPAHNLVADPILYEAKKESLPEIYVHYERGIDAILARHQLN